MEVEGRLAVVVVGRVIAIVVLVEMMMMIGACGWSSKGWREEYQRKRKQRRWVRERSSTAHEWSIAVRITIVRDAYNETKARSHLASKKGMDGSEVREQ